MLKLNVPNYESLLKSVYNDQYWKLHHATEFYRVDPIDFSRTPPFKAYRIHFKKRNLLNLNLKNNEHLEVLCKYMREKKEILYYELVSNDKAKDLDAKRI